MMIVRFLAHAGLPARNRPVARARLLAVRRTGIAAIAGLLVAGGACAQSTVGPLTPDPSGAFNRSVSFGLAHQRLGSGFGTWNDQYLRVVWEQDRRNLFSGELVHGNRFGETGGLGGAAWTHILDEDWFGTIGYNRTSAGRFWPISQTYASISRKWLDQRQLVTGLTLGRDESRDGYSARSATLSATWYAPGGLVVGLGVRDNLSEPGDVRTRRGFASVTWGSRGNAYLSLTHYNGREGYQLLNSTAITDFRSRETVLAWKQWLTKGAGFETRIFDYMNPFYGRTGIELGLFVEF